MGGMGPNENQGQPQNGTQQAYLENDTQPAYPPHAEGPNLQAEPHAPNQSPVPEDHLNPVVVVPEWPERRTKLDRVGRRYF